MLWAPFPLKEYNKMTAEKHAYVFFSAFGVVSALPAQMSKERGHPGAGLSGGWKTQALRGNQAVKSLKSVPFCIYG